MVTLITPLRESNAYIGLGKQTSGGTAVAPTLFPRWLDGSSISIDIKEEDIIEGDTSRHVGLVIKNLQSTKVKLTCWARPIAAGMLEEAGLGVGSDTVTPATINTTLSSGSTIGASSISVAANTGLTGSTQLSLALDPGLAAEEVAFFQPPVTGSGPYSLPVASSYNNGAGLIAAHTSAHVVRSATVHTETDQTDGDYYSVEVNLGGAAGITIRVRDCKVTQIKRSSQSGKLLKYEVEFVGITCLVQGSPATVVLENHQPFLFTQASGAWNIDGSLAGDALAITKFDLTNKNNLDEVQTEAVTLAATLFGKIDVEANLDVVYTNNTKITQAFFGGGSGTTDSQTMVNGSFTVTFTQADQLHTLTYTCLTLNYIKVGAPVMKSAGKAFMQSIHGKSTSNNGNNAYVIAAVVNNLQTTAY